MPGITVKKVGDKPNFWAVRFRDPRDVKTCRTPKWARIAAESVSKGALVRSCMYKDGNWKIQAVWIKKKGKSKEKAIDLAKRIQQKIER